MWGKNKENKNRRRMSINYEKYQAGECIKKKKGNGKGTKKKQK